MPVINGVGQSEYTPIKEDHYGRLLGWHIGVTQRAIQNQKRRFRTTYQLIDATAGCGILDDGTHGSPLVAIDKLNGLAVSYQAVFVEESRDVFAELDQNLPNAPTIIRRYARYQDVIDQLPKDNLQLGLLYIDPNGTPDFGAMRQFARLRPLMEILISVTATGAKRGGKMEVPLNEWLQRIGKRYWLIRKPYSAHHWTFLFGSDFDGFHKRYQKIEMEPTTSELGRQWLEMVSYTEAERLGKVQPPLTGLMPSTLDTLPLGQYGPK